MGEYKDAPSICSQCGCEYWEYKNENYGMCPPCEEEFWDEDEESEEDE